MENIIKTPPITSMKDAFSVAGKTVVVTGGGNGIGFGIAYAFAEAGASVAIMGRNAEKGQKALEQLKALGGNHIFIQCDVSDLESVKAAKETFFATYGHVDVIVNNAGVSTVKRFVEDTDLEQWHKVVDTDLHGVANMVQVFGKPMADAGNGGTIINVSSVGGFTATSAKSHPKACYSASKAAVNHFTRYMAIELGDYGIRINAIAPGLTHSDLDADLPKERRDQCTEQSPMHRFGEPIEIGALAVFIASPAACQITGQVFVHDGGISLI